MPTMPTLAWGWPLHGPGPGVMAGAFCDLAHSGLAWPGSELRCLASAPEHWQATVTVTVPVAWDQP